MLRLSAPEAPPGPGFKSTLRLTDCKVGADVIISLTALHLRCPCVYCSQPLARKIPVWLRVASGLVRPNRQFCLHSARTNDQLRDFTLLH